MEGEEKWGEGRESKPASLERVGKEGIQAGCRRKICLPQQKEEGVGGACLLKEQDRPLQLELCKGYKTRGDNRNEWNLVVGDDVATDAGSL